MAQFIAHPSEKECYICSGTPYKNYVSSILWIGKQNPIWDYQVLMDFNILGLSETVKIESVYLELYFDFVPNEKSIAHFTPYLILDTWDVETVNWYNKPYHSRTIKGDTVKISQCGLYKWDVTPIVLAWVSGVCTKNGILIKNDTKEYYVEKRAVSGKENRLDYLPLKPMLTINYENYVPGVATFITGKKFVEQKETVLIENKDKTTNTYDTSDKTFVTFFIKNTGNHPAKIKLQISPDKEEYIDEGEHDVEENQIIAVVPKVYSKYTRIYCYASEQNACLTIIYQACI